MNITAEVSDIKLFQFAFMLYSLWTQEQRPTNALATFLAQRESVSGQAIWKAYWKTVKCGGSKAISKHHPRERNNH